MTTATDLFNTHQGIARHQASRYYIPGADRDDVLQEALIALWVAANRYDPSRGMSFPAFASFVVRRDLDTCVARARRPALMLLTNAERTTAEGADAADTIPDQQTVEQLVEIAEDVRRLVRAVALLTVAERCALARLLNGETVLDGSGTSTQNHLRRARRKLREAA